ncbi:RING finger protein 37 isoform X2 [Boleophthalmus pectinirostris]|uniref:RING finger protein 37 isoform X2 n=1 Tax=Boleophthalmus pectinirostris TaxID=150288 RepID=UPI00242DBEE9|nr:RING finger protein 37 isoform X2 [Boleophthalmus pectinirostris]
MVVNLCLPQFHTTIHCNKLCADGYDVTNLVSADPALRRRGFKLEYFLRPPVQVTLTFEFKVELCRVDVELWPWGMDRGQACKKLEISTCSGPNSTKQIQQNKTQDHPQRKDRENGNLSQSNGHLWRDQAQKWGASEAQESTYQSNRESSNPDFKLVGRCELREETKVCFSQKHFRPRSPFQHPAPPPFTNCRHEELWSRGVQSLGAVTQLCVALPFGGAASALGLKALSVWGQPAKCCSEEEVERIRKAHEASERPTQTPVSIPPVCPPKRQKRAPTAQSSQVPEEFLDPITQEVMVLPMLLPSGVSVDHSTLEEYQKTEATWGRSPNDPFTGVPFTTSSQPLPHPQLKARIDHFLLQKGPLKHIEGRLGRQAEVNPHPSRLVASEIREGTCNADQSETKALNSGKRDLEISTKNTPENSQDTLLPQAKRPRNDKASEATCSSHEERLSASLDEALSSALQGRPSFTSNLSLNQPQHTQAKGTTNEKICSACSCSLSVYSAPASPFYRLICGHFLCRSCLQTPSKTLNPKWTSTFRNISCLTCHSSTPRRDVIRVHH